MGYPTVSQAERALNQKIEERDRALHSARSIAEEAAYGQRPDNAETDRAYQGAMNDFDRLSKEVDIARVDLDTTRDEDEMAAAFASSMARAGMTDKDFPKMGTVRNAEARYGRPFGPNKGFVDLTEVRRTPEEAGEYLRALLRDDVQTRATMTVGTNASGGYLVPVDYAAPLLDLARAQTRVAQLGARVIPLETTQTNVPRHDADPVFTFRNEAGAVTESGTTLGNVTLIPRMASTLIRASIELVEDSAVDFPSYIAEVIAAAAAVTIDQKALYGTGVAPDVRGVKTTTGVTVTNLGANGASLTTHDPLISLVGRVKGKGYPVTGMLLSPRTEGSLAGLREGAGSGQYLAQPKYLADIPQLTSTNVPVNLVVGTSGANCADVFAGDWSQVLIGMRHSLEIQVLREAYANTGEIAFIAHMRFDVQVARPAGIEVLSGILN